MSLIDKEMDEGLDPKVEAWLLVLTEDDMMKMAAVMSADSRKLFMEIYRRYARRTWELRAQSNVAKSNRGTT